MSRTMRVRQPVTIPYLAKVVGVNGLLETDIPQWQATTSVAKNKRGISGRRLSGGSAEEGGERNLQPEGLAEISRGSTKETPGTEFCKKIGTLTGPPYGVIELIKPLTLETNHDAEGFLHRFSPDFLCAFASFRHQPSTRPLSLLREKFSSGIDALKDQGRFCSAGTSGNTSQNEWTFLAFKWPSAVSARMRIAGQFSCRFKVENFQPRHVLFLDGLAFR
jgi:hypothetical protein